MCHLYLSAQRLSASLESSHSPALVLLRLNSCSTPFGIIGIFTHPRHYSILGQCVCSTPFGIIGIFTNDDHELILRPESAQRLSASLESSPLKTPALSNSRDSVLNAFRHHWNLHTINQLGDLASQSVLNAFRHHWNLHTCASTASVARLTVLNAFRHHWNLHLFQDFFYVAKPQVLNAFRHHWNLHVGRVVSPPAAKRVLNAFRHHWNLHEKTYVSVAKRELCSTPFGIIGIFTPMR